MENYIFVVFAILILMKAGYKMTYSDFSVSVCDDLESSLDKVCVLAPIWNLTAHTSYSSALIMNFGTGRDTRLPSHPATRKMHSG